MADDTTYTVVEDVDTSTGTAGSSSFFEGNGTNSTTPTGGSDDTNYQVVGDLSSMGQSGPAPSSFYEQGNIYEALTLAPDILNQITAQATLATADRVAADADAAAALLSANNAATSASAASASATGAASSAAAAAASATNSATSATASAGSASAAATSATAASGSATAASTSAGNAATSATAASGSAAAAATSATAASGSASAASTSATNAASSATAAATSATNAAASVQAVAGTATPLVDSGAGAVGTSTKWAHEDHKHPADTATADARIANAAGTVTPVVNGTAAVGTSAKWAHEDHVHPVDTTRAPLASPGLTGTPTAPTASLGTNTTQLATTAFVLANATGTGAVRYDISQTLTEAQKLQVLADLGVPFQCGYLSRTSATALKFAPCNGDLIKINGSIYRIPSAGITGASNTSVFVNGAAAQNLAASTLYFVYAFSNSGVVTADFSTTGHAPSGTAGNIGVEVKNGDDTRTLIGMVWTNASAQFVDGGAFCGVISWFNRVLKRYSVANGNPTTTSTSNVILGSGSVVCLNWSGVSTNALVEGQSTTSGTFGFLAVGLDGASTNFGASQFTYTGGPYPACIGGWDTAAEGAHSYYMIGGSASGSGTTQINNSNLTVSTFG